MADLVVEPEGLPSRGLLDGDLQRLRVGERPVEVTARAADVGERRPEGRHRGIEERRERQLDPGHLLAVEVEAGGVRPGGIGRPDARDRAGSAEIGEDVLPAPVGRLGAHVLAHVVVVEPGRAALVAPAAVAAGRGAREERLGPPRQLLQVHHLLEETLDADRLGGGRALRPGERRGAHRARHSPRQSPSCSLIVVHLPVRGPAGVLHARRLVNDYRSRDPGGSRRAPRPLHALPCTMRWSLQRHRSQERRLDA